MQDMLSSSSYWLQSATLVAAATPSVLVSFRGGSKDNICHVILIRYLLLESLSTSLLFLISIIFTAMEVLAYPANLCIRTT